MVAKGHHFPGVAVAAVVDADTGLAFPDFRAEERTFQLVTQLAGRSGRDAPGKVLVQTFQPDATPLAFAARHDVAGFLAQELARREELALSAVQPPRLDRRLGRRAGGAAAGCCASCATRSAMPGVAPARPGAAAPAARAPSRAARREDDVAPRVRAPCGGAARRGRAGDAPRRAGGRSSTSIRSRSERERSCRPMLRLAAR